MQVKSDQQMQVIEYGNRIELIPGIICYEFSDRPLPAPWKIQNAEMHMVRDNKKISKNNLNSSQNFCYRT